MFGRSPATIRTILAAGYPVERISEYRGRLQVWRLPGLTMAGADESAGRRRQGVAIAVSGAGCQEKRARAAERVTCMLPTLGLLLVCQLVGEVIVRGLGLVVPGPVVGLVLLLAALRLRPALAATLRPTVTVILANLSLLFVPAGVGVIGNLEVLSEDWVALLVVLVLSTLLAMLATVGTFIVVRRLIEGRAS